MTPLKYFSWIIEYANEKTGHDFIDTDITYNGIKIKCNKCGYKTKITAGDLSLIDNPDDIKMTIYDDVMTCNKHIIKNIIE